MREIKFRAWDNKKKEMIEMLPSDLGRPGFLMDFFMNVFEAQTPGEDNMKLMQFTGLRDWKGKDIYEGDIVKDHATVFKVEFVFAEWHFVKISGAYQYPAFYSNASRMEVIGNTYENPELLKGESL